MATNPRRTRRANSERLINWMWKRSEPTAEKAQIYREQVPGLVQLATLNGRARGAWWTGSRLFVVAGASLLEVFSDWTTANRGTLQTSTGRVEMAQGLFSLVLVDGDNGYILTLADNSFGQITDPDFYGANRVAFLDGKFIFTRPETQQFYWSEGIDNAAGYDGLDFASAESAPDNIVGHLVDHREIWLFGEFTTEVWTPAFSGDAPYTRNNGAVVEVGLAATHSAQQIDNSIYWLGRDKRGQGMVWMAGGSSGYQPLRISTQELEERLAELSDLSGAYAFTYQDAGQTFYVLQVPGLDTTWVFDASTRLWHERAELVAGDFEPWRAEVHAFAFGYQLVLDDSGKLYRLDWDTNTNAGDELVRYWITPHAVSQNRNRVQFDWLRLEVEAGETPLAETPEVEMRYSNDGGATWGAWAARSTGVTGRYDAMPQWNRLGQGRFRVWNFRCTDNARVSIVGIAVGAREMSS